MSTPALPPYPLQSGPSNLFGLLEFCSQRVPGYDSSEYIREINSAYIHVWEEISKLKNRYFTVFKTVTVVSPSDTFDLLYNANLTLSSAVGQRLYQVTRVRFMSPNGGMWQSGVPKDINHPDFVSVQSMSNPSPQMNGPYYYQLFGRGNMQLAMPVAMGTQIEIAYTAWPVALAILNNGSITTSGSSVTGTSTNFTQLVGPDFMMDLPQFSTTNQFFLADSGGNVWTLQITDQGFLQIIKGGTGLPQPLYINDMAAPTSYQIGVSTGGILTYAPIATFYPAYAQYLSLASIPSRVHFTLRMNGGFLQTVGASRSEDEQIQAELVVNASTPLGGQTYRVANILSDTQLTTMNPIVPVVSTPTANNYVLATVPEIPREHIRVIGSVALPKIYGWTGDDSRIAEATQIAEKNVQMMKDALIERQSQAPPQKQRFPGGIGRRNRMFLR